MKNIAREARAGGLEVGLEDDLDFNPILTNMIDDVNVEVGKKEKSDGKVPPKSGDETKLKNTKPDAK